MTHDSSPQNLDTSGAPKNAPSSILLLANILSFLLILAIASDGAGIFHDVSVLPVFARTTDVPEILSRMGGVWWGWLGVLTTCLSIVTAVLFLFWFHQAYKNLYAWGVQGMASTPGSAVVWWFVPVLNLFKPYQAFSQLWKASDPGADRQDPKSWKAAPGSPLMPFWWGLWLLTLFNLNFSGTAVNAQNLKLLTWVSLGTHTAHLIAGMLLILMVRAVSRRQEECILRSRQ